MDFFIRCTIYLILAITLLILFYITYLIWFQPPFYFPKPTGPSAVGIKTYHWIDEKRKETLGNNSKFPNRELMVTIWFPASGKLPEKPDVLYAPYFVNYVKNTNKRDWLKLGLNRPIYTYAQEQALPAQDKSSYPVIIFSHGYLCSRDSNTAQCQELASHGYIVVGISHTYDSCVVQFPDGRIIDGEKSMAQRLQKNTLTNRFKQRDQEIEIWTADVQFVIDQLEQLTAGKESFFYQRLDLAHIGMFGHSFGGSTTIQVCQRDPRVKAGVCLDWGLHGSNMTKAFHKPCMFLLSEDIKYFEQPWTQADWKKCGVNSLQEEALFKFHRLGALKALKAAIKNDAHFFTISDTKHMSFCDWVLLKHASVFSRFFDNLGAGSIDGLRATEIVNAYLVDFFDKYLKNKPTKIINHTSMKYPEVKDLYLLNPQIVRPNH